MKPYILLFLIGFSLNYGINTETRHFVDQEGRPTLFHGVNVVYKVKPYLPASSGFDAESFSEKDIEKLVELGINSVRLGLIWEGVETAPGVYNTQMLERYAQLIRLLANNDISVVVDLHQDLFYRGLCGEGVPMFYMEGIELNSSCKSSAFQILMNLLGHCVTMKDLDLEFVDGVPTRESCSRHSFHKLHEMAEFDSIYQNLYFNKNGLFDKLIALWKVILPYIKKSGATDNIVGIDLWNEPFPKRMLSSIMNLVPGYTTNREYKMFYKSLYEALKEDLGSLTVLLENSPFDTLPLFGGRIFGNYDKLPLGQELAHQQALNVHYYCFIVIPKETFNPEPSLESVKKVCRPYYDRKMAYDKAKADKLHVPLLVTEFGACSNSEACKEEIRNIVDLSEKYGVSWYYWNYKAYHDPTTSLGSDEEGIFQNNELSPAKRDSLVIPYIMKYQGVPVESHFDRETKVFTATFQYNPSISAPTKLFKAEGTIYSESPAILAYHTETLELPVITEDKHHFYLQFSSDKPGLISITLK